MAISSITTDYSGRTKDLHIFQGVNPPESSAITPSFGRISNYCTGIQKLIQRYAISLLTTIGSQNSFPGFGTNLMLTLSNTNLRINRSELYHIFNFANAKVVSEFRRYQQVNVQPDDEKLDTATLKDVRFADNTVYFDVQIYPVGSGPLSFILPLPLT